MLGNGIELKSGRFGPYLERDGKRASIPKDVPQSDLTLEMAESLLSLPREIGAHPETGNMITASIGRYGPYLRHDGKYGKLQSTREVFEVGMNRAVDILAQAANRGAGGTRAKAEPMPRLQEIVPAFGTCRIEPAPAEDFPHLLASAGGIRGEQDAALERLEKARECCSRVFVACLDSQCGRKLRGAELRALLESVEGGRQVFPLDLLGHSELSV